jgi:predicted transposase/invertase (TIGR01784 family)
MKAKYVNPFTDFEFKKIFGEEASKPNAEQYDYEQSLKSYRDLKGVIDTAFDEGKMEGKMEGKIEGKMEVAKALKANGIAIGIIASATGLTESEIEKL